LVSGTGVLALEQVYQSRPLAVQTGCQRGFRGREKAPGSVFAGCTEVGGTPVDQTCCGVSSPRCGGSSLLLEELGQMFVDTDGGIRQVPDSGLRVSVPGGCKKSVG
jgi:hypothetical protein